MKILCISDEENPSYWDFFTKDKLADIDLIISCGDLKPEYLSFLVTMGHAPLLYVHGNHDARYEKHPPEGCDCIDDQVVTVKGLRIAGLGGSVRYRPGPHQYTQQEMWVRMWKLWWGLHKGVDIVVTHAPVKDIGDLPTRTHEGFYAFRTLIEKFRPRYLLHGHVHLSYDPRIPRVHEYGGTRIINAFRTYILEL